MNSDVIIFISVAVLFILIASIGICIYIMMEKGHSWQKGFLLGLIPIIGQIISGIIKPTDKNLVNELYDRNLIDKNEHQKVTQEIDLKK